MNIFFLDTDPRIAAYSYCDQHLGKIRLDISQMLSTAYHLSPHVTVKEKYVGMTNYVNKHLNKPIYEYYVQGHRIYKQAFVNHHTCRWVRASAGNFEWTLEHLKALQEIWVRFGYDGSVTYHLLSTFEATKHLLLLTGNLTDVPLAMYDSVKENYKPQEPMKVAVQAYKQYMCAKVFKNDKRPTWSIKKQPE